jgi:enoyl-CoA hydratase/carnithine racemase
MAEGAESGPPLLAVDERVATLTLRRPKQANRPGVADLDTLQTHLDAIARGALDAEALARDVRRTLDSDDLREGQAAWAARRPPRFRGRRICYIGRVGTL